MGCTPRSRLENQIADALVLQLLTSSRFDAFRERPVVCLLQRDSQVYIQHAGADAGPTGSKRRRPKATALHAEVHVTGPEYACSAAACRLESAPAYSTERYVLTPSGDLANPTAHAWPTTKLALGLHQLMHAEQLLVCAWFMD